MKLIVSIKYILPTFTSEEEILIKKNRLLWMFESFYHLGYHGKDYHYITVLLKK